MELFLEYAYPTSTTAKNQGYSKEGCWYISQGTLWGKREILVVLNAKNHEKSKALGRKILEARSRLTGLPIGRYSH